LNTIGKFTIQQVAKKTGLSIHAYVITKYEKVGLLTPIQRASNGHRRYSSEDITWLEFLVRLRETGMSIQKVLAFADLVRQHPNEVGGRCVLLEEHRDRNCIFWKRYLEKEQDSKAK